MFDCTLIILSACLKLRRSLSMLVFLRSDMRETGSTEPSLSEFEEFRLEVENLRLDNIFSRFLTDKFYY